jgi:hypothetical protein
MKNEGLPIHRFGTHVVMVPEAFATWLTTREKYQIARRAARGGAGDAQLAISGRSPTTH